MIKSDNDKNERIYDLLTQDSYFILNRKLNSCVGLILGAFIVFLLDKEKYHKYNGELTPDGYFYATDMDIMIMTGLKSSQVTKLKSTAVEKNLVFIKKEGIPLKTYYKINLERINEIMNINKSAVELSYERIIFESKEQEDISSLLNVSETTLSNLTFRDLRFICKKFKISYNGKNTKEEIIEKIIEEKEELIKNNGSKPVKEKVINSSSDISSIQDLKNMTFKNLRLMCKELNISYSGKDTKNILINKIADIKGFLIEIETNTEVENNIRLVEKNDIHEEDIDFEALFKEFNISYTLKNQEAIKKLREKMKDKDVVLYLKETYENIKQTPEVKNIGALFSSKIAKGERQILSKNNSTSKQSIKKVNPVNEEELTFVSDKDTDEEILKSFENFPIEKRNKIEEKAILLCSSTQSINSEFLETLKNKNRSLFIMTIRAYLLEILKDNSKEAS